MTRSRTTGRGWEPYGWRPHTDSVIPEQGRRPSLAALTDEFRLLDTFKQLRRFGGQAPGPDGLRYDDFTEEEVLPALQRISREIASGNYRHGPTRTVSIPKRDGSRRRELRISNIADRVVARSLAAGLARPIQDWKRQRIAAVDASSAIVPSVPLVGTNLTVWGIIARAIYSVEVLGRSVITCDDIRNAFPSLRIELAMSSFAEALGPRVPDVLELIRRILCGTDGAKRAVGVDQGCPLSPLALEVSLFRILDIPIREMSMPAPLRYVDDLVSVAGSVTEAQSVMQTVSQKLRKHGFSLRGSDPDLSDLREDGSFINFLGATLRKTRRGLTAGIPDEAWSRLQGALGNCWKDPDPGNSASDVLQGWTDHYGFAFVRANRGSMVNRVRSLLRETHLLEAGSKTDLLGWINSAADRWTRYRERKWEEWEDDMLIHASRAGRETT